MYIRMWYFGKRVNNMEIKFANNASTLLLDNILEGTTLLNVLPDTGDLFPELHDPADYFKITLVNPGDGSYEIMHVTKVEGDQFTVERGKENTIALQFPQNSIVENRLTAGSIEHILNDVAATSSTPGRIRVATEAEIKSGVVADAALTPAYATSIYVPVGFISAYHGQLTADGFVIDAATSKIRTDWHVCDGTNNTPDLRGRFILGSDTGHSINTTGGSWNATPDVSVDGTTLTVDQIPSHVHDTNIFAVRGPFYGTSHGNVLGYDASHNWHTTNNSTNYTGGGKSHTHSITTKEKSVANPYYVLVYIKKIN